MFKNSVLNSNVNTIKWIKAAGIRAVKTMAQTAVGMLTVGIGVSEIDWVHVVSVSAVAGIVSLLTSITGIPEVTEEEN